MIPAKHIGLTFTIILLRDYSFDDFVCAQSSATQCRTVGGDRLKMDCVNVKLQGVPKDFDHNMKYLDISQNHLKEINSDSFTPYRELVDLKMTEVLPKPLPVSQDVFKSLEKLASLNLTSTFFSFSNLNWPLQIKTLILDHSSFTNPDLSSLLKLEVFSAKSCLLENFPKFHPKAPLKSIDLRYNTMNRMELVQIAPYCQLHVVMLDFGPTQLSSLRSQTNYCKCVKLEKWSSQFAITGIHPLNCSKRSEQDCEADTSEEAELRAICLKGLKSGIPFWILVSALFLGAVFMILCLSYIFRNLLQKQTESSSGTPTGTPTSTPSATESPNIIAVEENTEEVEQQEEEEE